MTPEEIIRLARQMSRTRMPEGSRRQLSIPLCDWESLCEYVKALEPIVSAFTEHHPITHLYLHGIEVIPYDPAASH